MRTEPVFEQNRVTCRKINIFAPCCIVTHSQHSVAPVVISLGVARPGNCVSIPVAGLVSFFFFPKCPDQLWEHPVSYSIGNGGTFLGDKGDRV